MSTIVFEAIVVFEDTFTDCFSSEKDEVYFKNHIPTIYISNHSDLSERLVPRFPLY